MLKITQPKKVDKAWGTELWIHNEYDYCGKILRFNPDSKFSFHFHIKKTESWFIAKGRFELKHIDLNTGETYTNDLKEGDVIHIPRGEPHQLFTKTGGDIFEVSTTHYDDDSFRIGPGDSQK